MATITLGATVRGITERKIVYSDGAQQQTILIHDVLMEVAGLPPQVLPLQTFTVPVLDQAQWNSIFVGQALDVVINIPAV